MLGLHFALEPRPTVGVRHAARGRRPGIHAAAAARAAAPTAATAVGLAEIRAVLDLELVARRARRSGRPTAILRRAATAATVRDAVALRDALLGLDLALEARRTVAVCRAPHVEDQPIVCLGGDGCTVVAAAAGRRSETEESDDDEDLVVHDDAPFPCFPEGASPGKTTVGLRSGRHEFPRVTGGRDL